MQFHEASCLLEDLASIVKYFKIGNFAHPMDQKIIETRHHMRHDIRDTGDSRTAKRRQFLQLDDRLVSKISFDKDVITLGSVEIKITDVKSYIDWANEIMEAYIEDARASDKLKNGRDIVL